MKRTHYKTGAQQAENILVEEFLEEIEAVCLKHKFTLSHEDHEGAFIVEPYDLKNIEWLRDAFINY